MNFTPTTGTFFDLSPERPDEAEGGPGRDLREQERHGVDKVMKKETHID